MELELERSGEGGRAPESPVTPRTLLKALAVHAGLLAAVGLTSWISGRDVELPPPVELTVVPPWAVQTDDPEPDPLPPPEETARQKTERPPPAPEKADPAPDAVVREKPQKKTVAPPRPKEKVDLRAKAKFVKASPPSLRDKARFKDVPPDVPRTGKGTAADKPMTAEEFTRLMAQGYKIGARNQLATSEEQRCVSLIKRAIQLEWDKESFSWFPGLSPLRVELRLGLGGQVLGFRILGGSGSGDVDRTARNALGRVRSIPGLSPSFLRACPVIEVRMTPVQGG